LSTQLLHCGGDGRRGQWSQLSSESISLIVAIRGTPFIADCALGRCPMLFPWLPLGWSLRTSAGVVDRHRTDFPTQGGTPPQIPSLDLLLPMTLQLVGGFIHFPSRPWISCCALSFLLALHCLCLRLIGVFASQPRRRAPSCCCTYPIHLGASLLSLPSRYLHC